MKKEARLSARPPVAKIDGMGVIALRLPSDELARTLAHAAREDRPAGNFARRVYLMGLTQYETEQARAGATAAA
jgi:hypothetical protein